MHCVASCINENFCFRLLEEKEERISDLEGSMSQLKKEAEDTCQLLEEVQNDKTALSRAMAQNKDLKQQLVELQSGFVKMVNILASIQLL
jgi:DNA repair ATPase RecN